jgi:hypothetical protein
LWTLYVECETQTLIVEWQKLSMSVLTVRNQLCMINILYRLSARKQSQITKCTTLPLSCRNVKFLRSLVPFPASFPDWWTNLNSSHNYLPMTSWFRLPR